ncbi:MAG: penicillin-binding protein 2, partial [Synechococcaceae cyanobacterium]
MGIAPGRTRHTGVGPQPVLLLLFVLLLSGAITSRLAWLQLIHGAENRAMAEENRIRLIPRDPVRGRLLDRQGRLLASNRLLYRLHLEPRLVAEAAWPDLRDRLARLLAIPADQLERQRRQGVGPDGFRLPLTGPLTPMQVLRLKEQAPQLRGVDVGIEVLRAYPHGSLAAHVIGYTSSIGEEEYQR